MQEFDSARVAVLLGLSIGLGIAVHEGFFLVAGVVVVGAIAAVVGHALREHAEHTRLAYRAR